MEGRREGLVIEGNRDPCLKCPARHAVSAAEMPRLAIENPEQMAVAYAAAAPSFKGPEHPDWITQALVHVTWAYSLTASMLRVAHDEAMKAHIVVGTAKKVATAARKAAAAAAAARQATNAIAQQQGVSPPSFASALILLFLWPGPSFPRLPRSRSAHTDSPPPPPPP